MSQIAQMWKSVLEADLAGFADRGAPPAVSVDGNTLSATWMLRGQPREHFFVVDEQNALIWIAGADADNLSYREFLASSEMADFDQLAAAITRAQALRTDFVPASAVVDFGRVESDEVVASADLISDLARTGQEEADGTTRLFFVKGAPGAGKTTLLTQATAGQARSYTDGATDLLLLFVSAQGRELSNLRDALSGELQDLRAGFTRDAVPTLTRNGLLVPVIDGFDELLGTAGYGGAFSSLQTLLADLGGRGAVVVSARSAFYYLEFQNRSGGRAGEADLTTTTIDLQPWNDEQLNEYLGAVGGPDPSLVNELSDTDRELLRRPFFAREFRAYTDQVGAENGHTSLLDYLIGAYIQREATKIVDANNDPVLPVDGHRRLFELAASEMWEAESRSLAVSDLQALMDLIGEEFELGGDERRQLTMKVTSYAGFSQGPGGTDEFAFEHAVYFDYFLSQAVRRLLLGEQWSELGSFFGRGIIPQGVIATAVQGGGVVAGDALLRGPDGLHHENRRRNQGTVVVALAANPGPLEGVRVTKLDFVDIGAAGATFRDVVFDGCAFAAVDLAGTRFESCDLADSTFHGVRLSNETRMDIRGLRPGRNVSFLHHDHAGDIYAPEDIKTVLQELGAPDEETVESAVYSPRALVLIKLLQRVARLYRRTNILFEDEELHKSLGREGREYWPALRGLLVDAGVVTEETRAVAGPKRIVLRLQVSADQILVEAGDQHPAVARLWDLLRST